MKKKFGCVMLVDDNPDDNFFHKRIIATTNAASLVVVKETGQDALDYLVSNAAQPGVHPDIIFLDINMPQMSGWDFLDEYGKLERKARSKNIVMLTTSDNPDDVERAQAIRLLSGFKTKPLTQEQFVRLVEEYA